MERPVLKQRKMLFVAVALASGVTLECDEAAGIGLFDSGLGCEPSTSFTSYCAVLGVTTSCGVSVSCDDGGTTSGFESFTTCTVPIPASDCEVTVTLADGTQRKIPVSVYAHGDCGSPAISGIALPLECSDAGLDAGVLDASDAMIDATEDTTYDAGGDATSD